MPIPFDGFAAISPATNVPCPSVSCFHEPPTNEIPRSDPADELRMRVVDARVDHRDLDRRELRAASGQ